MKSGAEVLGSIHSIHIFELYRKDCFYLIRGPAINAVLWVLPMAAALVVVQFGYKANPYRVELVTILQY